MSIYSASVCVPNFITVRPIVLKISTKMWRAIKHNTEFIYIFFFFYDFSLLLLIICIISPMSIYIPVHITQTSKKVGREWFLFQHQNIQCKLQVTPFHHYSLLLALVCIHLHHPKSNQWFIFFKRVIRKLPDDYLGDFGRSASQPVVGYTLVPNLGNASWLLLSSFRD